MNRAYLLTGGNLGNREENLALVRTGLTALGHLLAVSSIYETAAWGKLNQPPFLNQALLLETPLKSLALLQQLLQLEEKLGRVRTEKYGPRLVDIDILLFNDEISGDPVLRLPHPELTRRRFALTPLAEIAPQLMHPVLRKTIIQLLEECEDGLEVRRRGES
jgi:2-amino-4-hydroxy-6-hydroxymethyldihydropteridine diphosphokinase